MPVALVMATVCWAADVCWKVNRRAACCCCCCGGRLAANSFKMVDHTLSLMSSQVTTAPERKSERKGSTDAHIMIDRISLGNAASSPYASQYVSQTECCVSVLIGLIQWFSVFFFVFFFCH